MPRAFPYSCPICGRLSLRQLFENVSITANVDHELRNVGGLAAFMCTAVGVLAIVATRDMEAARTQAAGVVTKLNLELDEAHRLTLEAGLTAREARLARMSYAHYLTDIARVDPQIVKLYQNAPQALFGLGIDAMSAQDAWGYGFLGFRGLNLEPGAGNGRHVDHLAQVGHVRANEVVLMRAGGFQRPRQRGSPSPTQLRWSST